mmetsp:Transcript_87257/g.251664  ORF Transcript_87257/g.251664 Transcript_87257/m.251664 type:complete len:224 (+) Transcript_87257:454-1125(+)
MTRLNAGLSSQASYISCSEMVPLTSLSMSAHTFKSSILVFCCSLVFSLAFWTWSLSRASAALSTITAKMRFMTPRDTESTMAINTKAVTGAFSITATEMVAQLSPAMICENKVNMEPSTVSNPRWQRSQKGYSMLAFTGCTNSTSTIDQRASINARISAPKAMALNELTRPTSKKYNSRMDNTMRKARVTRAIRKIRNQATSMLEPTANENQPRRCTLAEIRS